MTEKEIPKPDRAVLVGLVQRGESAQALERSMDELEGLLNTAGGECVARLTQSKEAPDARTMIGSGKAAELAYLCACNDVDLVVFDCELSPSQIRNLENIVGDEVRVIDRSMLILDIFALHAVTGEGKLQVELAQLKYTAPRLMGRGTELSRLGGGIGTRGPGESQLETDRRHLQRRIRALEAQIDEMEKNRKTMRASRDRSGIVQVAIVGYTNAGKSTLLNALTDAGILAEDKLFATLDPTTRKFELPGGEQVLLTDTVGFIRKLPHHLVNAFKSTLDEAVYSDVVMILCDASDPECMSQLECTEQTLEELGAGGKPTIYVFNKCDKGLFDQPIINRTADKKHVVFISAKTGQGCDELAEVMQEVIHEGKKRVTFKIPNSEMGAMNILYKNATVEDVDYGADFVSITAVVDAKTHGMLKKYDENYPVVSEEDF